MPNIAVHFHGHFRSFAPDPVTVAASTVLEAVDLVTRQLPAFRPNAARGRYTVKVKGFETEADLRRPADVEEIHVWPAMLGGGGNGGFFKIIIGVVLIAVAVVTGQVYLGATIYGLMVGMGASLVLGGLLELISPAPKIDLSAGQDPEASKYLGAGQNTVKIGTRIPLLYGEHRVYGHYISFNIDAKDVNAGDGTPAAAAAPTITPSDHVEVGAMTTTGLVVSLPSELADCTHIHVTGIHGGTLFQADGATQVPNDQYVTKEAAQLGFRFLTASNSVGFAIQAAKLVGFGKWEARGKVVDAVVDVAQLPGGEGGDGGGE